MADQRFKQVVIDPGARLARFAGDVRAGLTNQPKTLSCCYFYDAEGSRLFEEICDLPEYYLTRAEREILEAHANELSQYLPGDIALVELGSGNAVKTRIIIDALFRHQKKLRYIPVDICRTVLEDSSIELLRAYPRLEVLAIAGEYHEGLRHLDSTPDQPKLILWLGSNIGNFDRPAAIEFLKQVRSTMHEHDRLLVGIDLRKERDLLEKAYDDAQGVTAQFNLNLLARINRELSGHFNLNQFHHRSVYDDHLGRVEMHLDSLCAQEVAIERLGMKIPFAAGESIHTENSYKYSLNEIQQLAGAIDMKVAAQWLDRERRFSVNLFA